MSAARETTTAKSSDLKRQAATILDSLGVDAALYSHAGPQALPVRSPITGENLGVVREQSPAEMSAAVAAAHAAYLAWRHVPPPRRGEFVRQLAQKLRAVKADLGRLISIEVGKIVSEGLGEVQEAIDISDFAVGLSRQLYGLTIASERSRHRIMETWHPLGVCGVITAFNFPAGVWSWNAALTFVCGNSMVWKPSEKTPLSSLAIQALIERTMQEFGPDAPQGLAQLVIGGGAVGEALVTDERVPLISATGSCALGHRVAPLTAKRFARTILELGGNNAAIVAPSADLQLVLRSASFAALGTAGQRCTTLRRLIVHSSIHDALVSRLKTVFASVRVGNPLEPQTLIGPLIDETSYRNMAQALSDARAAGGVVFGGERVLSEQHPQAFYVRPALVEMPAQTGPMLRETFAPILYVTKYETLDQAIELNNQVSAGLSSAIFTLDMREAERFTAVGGSDCGVINVNIGSSGAEIGGAFGGEKESGGGREAGSDAWKGYMRRATTTVNYGRDLPLAQGVEFQIEEGASAAAGTRR